MISLGSNLGNRLENLQGAIDALEDTPGVRIKAVSPVYETEPWGWRRAASRRTTTRSSS